MAAHIDCGVGQGASDVSDEPNPALPSQFAGDLLERAAN
jgi:hypothetical protein